ncbi:MAG: hypothetical protein ACXWCS_14290 [Burkholderiales bacterium]
MLAALLPILEAVLPPLAKALWGIIQDAMQGKIDHGQAVAAMHQALADSAASMASFKDALAKADADFKAQLAAMKK